MDEPQIRYFLGSAGASLAYYDLGEGSPLVMSPNLWSHLSLTWHAGAREGALSLVRRGLRLIRYDMRGMGLSDRSVDDFSLPAQVGDIAALRERTGITKFALYGVVHGCLPAIAYAAQFPEHVTHLILVVPFADGDAWYRRTPTFQGLEALRAMGDVQWKLYVETHAAALSGMLGAGDPREMAAIMEQSATPGTLSGYLRALRTIDVTPLLEQIRCPTLVLSSGSDLDRPHTSAVVSRIRDVQLIAVAPGASPFAQPTQIAPHIIRFIAPSEADSYTDAESIGGPAMPARHITTTIMFTDIADSTVLTERMGDAAFRDASRALDAGLRAAIRDAGGAAVEGKLLGDGVLATFSSAADAIDAARRCRALSASAELGLHIGLHAGDVIREGDNVYGGAVNLAARICSLSAPGEVLVSDVVRGMARSSAGVAFDDRGEHTLRGIAEPVRVYAVRWREAR